MAKQYWSQGSFMNSSNSITFKIANHWRLNHVTKCQLNRNKIKPKFKNKLVFCVLYFNLTNGIILYWLFTIHSKTIAQSSVRVV